MDYHNLFVSLSPEVLSFHPEDIDTAGINERIPNSLNVAIFDA